MFSPPKNYTQVLTCYSTTLSTFFTLLFVFPHVLHCSTNAYSKASEAKPIP